MRVLGVDVDAALMRRWRDWLAPDVQPFFVESLRGWPKSVGRAGALSPELRDTYTKWKLAPSLKMLWLDEHTFFGMPRAQRAELVRAQVRHGRGAVPSVRQWSDLLDPTSLRSQADGHRFVWWPSLLTRRADEIVARAVTSDEPVSRHREVKASTWKACAHLVPSARALAGSFPSASGPNCFATVMAAAGVDAVANERMLQRPFLDWLASSCRRGGHDDEPGTVLVWRDGERLPVHAAVTLGDGWAFEKPSQEWSTPRVVLDVRDLVRVNRARGRRLERHHIALGRATP